MEFCKKCGGLMVPEKGPRKIYLICRNCSYKKEMEKNDFKFGKSIKKKRDILVIEKEVQTLPKVKVQCPKCGNMEAYWWLQQTRSIDEAQTRFLKCTKCGYTWREYD